MQFSPRGLHPRRFVAELMTMWRIDAKVGNAKNDTPDILDPASRTDLFE
jgi:hypothetical protein